MLPRSPANISLPVWEHVTFVSILVAVRGLGLCSQGIYSLATYNYKFVSILVAVRGLGLCSQGIYSLATYGYLHALKSDMLQVAIFTENRFGSTRRHSGIPAIAEFHALTEPIVSWLTLKKYKRS